MLELLLLRHAKAEQGGVATADRDRPLAPRGHAQSLEMGRRMAEAGYRPARIICSSALRTRETLLGILPALMPNLPAGAEIRLDPRLYEGSDATYLDVIRAEPSAGPILLIGHNPAIQALAHSLVGDSSEPLRAAVAAKYPTGALAVIAFEAERWADVEPQTGRLKALMQPAA